MLKAILIASCVCLALPAKAQFYNQNGFGGGGLSGQHSVQGYTNQNGTYVQPHMQTNPNSTMNDNWSTRGNSNPYTGQPGYVTPRY